MSQFDLDDKISDGTDLLKESKPIGGDDETPIKEVDLESDEHEDNAVDAEEKEVDLEEDPEKEEKIEDIEFTGPISRKAVLAKYPTIFKDFPGLEHAYYREQKYAELLPTVEDAKIAVERSDVLGKFESDISKGSIEGIFDSVRKANPESFGQIVDNLLPNLKQVDQQAYNTVVGNVFSHAIAAMFTQGKNTENEQLQQAASLLNQFIFGTTNYVAPKRFGKEVTESDKQLQTEKSEFGKQKFESAVNDVTRRNENTIKSTIANNIDPKEQMTEYVKSKAVSDAIDKLNTQMNDDRRFRSIIDKLWERAAQNNFNRNALQDIERAYRSKAKTLIGGIIQQTRIEALKGLKGSKDRENVDRKGPIAPGRSAAPINRGSTKEQAKAIPRNVKTFDFLNSD